MYILSLAKEKKKNNNKLNRFTSKRRNAWEPPATEYALSNATVTENNDGSDKEDDAEEAWPAFQQEREQVEHDH